MTKKYNNDSWFNVNRIGLRKVQDDRNKIFIIKELVSNAFDEDIKSCDVQIDWRPDGSVIRVTDDSPEGFKKLADAYTLFNESYKAGNTEQRGRFSLGSKFSLAMFKSAKIISTKGTILFKSDNTRSKTSTKRDFGTVFEGIINLRKKDYDSLINLSKTIIPPKDVEFKVNGEIYQRPNSHSVLEVTLPSVTVDEEGNFRPTSRQTEVELFSTSSDKNYICELGIPVVETEMPFTVNVNQKVPLSKDRDNVSPSYLKKLMAFVLNETHDDLDDEELQSTWSQVALEQKESSHDARKRVLESKFGDDFVVYDPSDPEANNKAFSEGKQVVHGSQLSKEAWTSVRDSRDHFGGTFAVPSGRHQSYTSDLNMSNGAEPVPMTTDIQEIVNYAYNIHDKLGFGPLRVVVHDGSGALAMYGSGQLQLFYNELGKSWFDLKGNKQEILSLFIHEFGHYYSGDHLSKHYHDGLCTIGAKLIIQQV